MDDGTFFRARSYLGLDLLSGGSLGQRVVLDDGEELVKPGSRKIEKEKR